MPLGLWVHRPPPPSSHLLFTAWDVWTPSLPRAMPHHHRGGGRKQKPEEKGSLKAPAATADVVGQSSRRAGAHRPHVSIRSCKQWIDYIVATGKLKLQATVPMRDRCSSSCSSLGVPSANDSTYPFTAWGTRHKACSQPPSEFVPRFLDFSAVAFQQMQSNSTNFYPVPLDVY